MPLILKLKPWISPVCEFFNISDIMAKLCFYYSKFSQKLQDFLETELSRKRLEEEARPSVKRPSLFLILFQPPAINRRLPDNSLADF